MIIFHLSKLWKAQFSILCDVIFLVRLQEKFDIDHCERLDETCPKASSFGGGAGSFYVVTFQVLLCSILLPLLAKVVKSGHHLQMDTSHEVEISISRNQLWLQSWCHSTVALTWLENGEKSGLNSLHTSPSVSSVRWSMSRHSPAILVLFMPWWPPVSTVKPSIVALPRRVTWQTWPSWRIIPPSWQEHRVPAKSSEAFH